MTRWRRQGWGAILLLQAAFQTSSLPSLAQGTSEETVTPVLQKALPDFAGKTFTSITVDFAPGVKAHPHRHGDAFVYAYVLSGTVRSQLDDAPAQTYRAGDSWFELPGAHHRLTENASSTEAARLLVVFVSTAGQPLKTDDPK